MESPLCCLLNPEAEAGTGNGGLKTPVEHLVHQGFRHPGVPGAVAMHGTPARVGSKDLSLGRVEFCSQQIVGGNYLAVGTQIQPAGNETSIAPPEVNWGASGLHPEPDDVCNC